MKHTCHPRTQEDQGRMADWMWLQRKGSIGTALLAKGTKPGRPTLPICEGLKPQAMKKKGSTDREEKRPKEYLKTVTLTPRINLVWKASLESKWQVTS